MIGTFLNAGAIVVGCGLGWLAPNLLTPVRQQTLKFALGALTMWVGLRLAWNSVNGGFWGGAKLLGLALLAMILGRLAGRWLRLQYWSNRLGQFAKARIQTADQARPRGPSDGFVTCAALFCVTPLAILGSLQDGLTGYWPTLGLKAVMDALAAMSFVAWFGWSVLLAVVPLVAWQGTLTLLAQWLAPSLSLSMIEAIHATGGLLVFTVALVVWEIKKIEFMDYLPSLAVAPLLVWVLDRL